MAMLGHAQFVSHRFYRAGAALFCRRSGHRQLPRVEASNALAALNQQRHRSSPGLPLLVLNPSSPGHKNSARLTPCRRRDQP